MDIANKLFSAAVKAREKAYAPYSEFKVGAAIYADDLQIYKGCNVENISYPCGTCAEAGAVAAMVANGATRILEILVLADSAELILPCGACLQRIAEFADDNAVVHLANLKGVQKSIPFRKLMPYAFNSKELHK